MCVAVCVCVSLCVSVQTCGGINRICLLTDNAEIVAKALRLAGAKVDAAPVHALVVTLHILQPNRRNVLDK